MYKEGVSHGISAISREGTEEGGGAGTEEGGSAPVEGRGGPLHLHVSRATENEQPGVEEANADDAASFSPLAPPSRRQTDLGGHTHWPPRLPSVDPDDHLTHGSKASHAVSRYGVPTAAMTPVV